MNQKILFSPVGGTDPISMTNCHDGSLIHICRVYKPDRVIMYMSKEVLENQQKDDRYRYCLNRLAKMQGREMSYDMIERPELTNVHEFDFFYEEFRTIIKDIYHEMDETDELLLNVSSGTPAMKSGLLVLQTLGEFPAKIIQVATPEKKMNEHAHKDYDVELLWELNEDNQEHFENRCKEIFCPTLSKIKKEEIIKKHILVYDYTAALDVAETMEASDTAQYIELLRMASKRALLDMAAVDECIKKTGYQCLPVQTSSGRKSFEYALSIDTKLRRAEYADFIRAITPIAVDLFERITKQQCKIDINDYCDQRKKNGHWIRKWSEKKLKGTDVGKVLDEAYKSNGGFHGGDISSIHLNEIIKSFCGNGHLSQLTEDVRSVETNVRNLAAHDIVSVTEDSIKALTGFSGEKIMNMIKELFDYTNIRVKKEYWDSYDKMNEEILKRMNLEQE